MTDALAEFASRKGEPDTALALAAGATQTEAAERGGVAERTVQRRVSDPRYRQQVERLRTVLLDRAVGLLADASAEAATILLDLARGASSEHVRLGAARAILDLAPNLRHDVSLAERIEELEAQSRLLERIMTR